MTPDAPVPIPVPGWRRTAGWLAYVALTIGTGAFLYWIAVGMAASGVQVVRQALGAFGRAPAGLPPGAVHRLAAYGWLASVAGYAGVFGVERIAPTGPGHPAWVALFVALLLVQALGLAVGAVGTALWCLAPRAGPSSTVAAAIHACIPFAWTGFFLVQLVVALH